jgi:hypothetical protein
MRFALKQLGAFFDGAENDTQESLANQMACMDQGRCQHAQKPFAEENPGHSDFTVNEAILRSHSTKSPLAKYVDRPSSLTAPTTN